MSQPIVTIHTEWDEKHLTWEMRATCEGHPANEAVVYISPRNSYCDRGHWQAHVDGIPSIDHADSFPRYFMRLSVAKQEMGEWLAWRLFKVRAEPFEYPTLIDRLVERKT